MAEQVYTDTSGAAWIVWMQEKQSSCAAAAAYMAVTMRKLQSMRGGEKRYINKMIDSGSKYTDFITYIGNKSMKQIEEILKTEGLKVRSDRAELKELKAKILASSTTLPLIVNVAWNNGGAHQIIAAGVKRSQMMFLDPVYGLIEQSMELFPGYAPVRNVSTDKADGTFSGWYTQIY